MTIYIAYRCSSNSQNRMLAENPSQIVLGLFHGLDGSWFSRAPCHLPCCQNKVDNIIDPFAFLDTAEDGRTIPSHQLGIAIHDLERCIHVLRNIDLKMEMILNQMRGHHINMQFALLITNKSDCDIPGPPFRGILSPPYESRMVRKVTSQIKNLRTETSIT